MAKFEQACRNCVHYNLKATQNATGAVIRDRMAACKWDWKEFVALPESVTKAYAFKGIATQYMSPDAGKNCPCFVYIAKADRV